MYLDTKRFQSKTSPRLGDMEGFFTDLFKKPFKTIQKQVLPGVAGVFTVGLVPPKMIGIKGHASNVAYRTGRDITIAAGAVAGAVYAPALFGSTWGTWGTTLLGGAKSIGGGLVKGLFGGAGKPGGLPSAPVVGPSIPPGYVYDPTTGGYVPGGPTTQPGFNWSNLFGGGAPGTVAGPGVPSPMGPISPFQIQAPTGGYTPSFPSEETGAVPPTPKQAGILGTGGFGGTTGLILGGGLLGIMLIASMGMKKGKK